MPRLRHAVALATVVAGLAACSPDGSDTAPTIDTTVGTTVGTPSRRPVIVDYSPTVSDAGALLYVASAPDLDLLAVTLAGTGEADCDRGVFVTRQLLTVAGHPDVPVGCGRETPLVGSRDWPVEWRAAANRFAGPVLPSLSPTAPVDGEALLASTLASAADRVTLLTLGPLTNVGAVLSARPDLVARIDRIVIMGGAVDVAGNVDAAPTAEWNLYVDPEGARRTLAAGAPVTLVALDATNQVPWTAPMIARLGLLDTPAGIAEHQLVDANRSSLDGIYLWDELAAMVAHRPDLVVSTPRAVRVDDDGATVAVAGGIVVDVATTVDVEAARTGFLTVLNGGTAAAVEPLTAAETAYLERLAEIRATADAATRVSEEATLTATDLVENFWDAVTGAADALAAIEPPPSFAADHAALLAAWRRIVDREAGVLAALDLVTVTDPFEAAFAALTSSGAYADLEHADAVCAEITRRSVVAGGPEVCPAGV